MRTSLHDSFVSICVGCSKSYGLFDMAEVLFITSEKYVSKNKHWSQLQTNQQIWDDDSWHFSRYRKLAKKLSRNHVTLTLELVKLERLKFLDFLVQRAPTSCEISFESPESFFIIFRYNCQLSSRIAILKASQKLITNLSFFGGAEIFRTQFLRSKYHRNPKKREKPICESSVIWSMEVPRGKIFWLNSPHFSPLPRSTMPCCDVYRKRGIIMKIA